MAQKQEVDIGLSIYNKENNDLTYTIVDKKEMNGILHYLIESRGKTNSNKLFMLFSHSTLHCKKLKFLSSISVVFSISADMTTYLF